MRGRKFKERKKIRCSNITKNKTLQLILNAYIFKNVFRDVFWSSNLWKFVIQCKIFRYLQNL